MEIAALECSQFCFLMAGVLSVKMFAFNIASRMFSLSPRKLSIRKRMKKRSHMHLFFMSQVFNQSIKQLETAFASEHFLHYALGQKLTFIPQ